MGDSTQRTSSGTKTEPWGPTIPYLKDILRGFGNIADRWKPTGNEKDALAQMQRNAQNYQGFGSQATDLTNRFLSGDPNNLLMPGYQAYKDAMTPLATADLDPRKNPAIADVLSTIESDVSNNVNGMFAGAGRDLSGMHTQALGRGLSQGFAQPLLDQYNKNVAHRMGASSGLLGAAGATSTAMGNNQQAGMNMTQMLPGIINQPQMMQLQAQAAKRNLPLQNLAQLEALLLPIAGLGQQSRTQSWTTNSPSPMSQIGQGLQLAGTVAGLGGSIAGMPMLSGGMNPFGGFTGNSFPGNPAAAGAQVGSYGGQYFPMFG